MNRMILHLVVSFLMVIILTYQPAAAQDFNFEATQTAGIGKADIKINIVAPAETTGDSYRVTFSVDELGGTLYSVENLGTQAIVVDALSIEETSPTFEGVQVTVNIPATQIDEIVEVRYAGDPVEPPVHVFRQGDRQGRGGNNSSGEYTFVSGGGGGFASVALREANTLGNDYEMRFDGNSDSLNYLVYGFTATGTIPVPFSFWNIGKGTPADTSDDRQIIAVGFDDSGNSELYDGGVAPSDGGPGDMFDRIYVLEIDPTVTAEADINSDGVVDYDDFLMDLENNGGDLSSLGIFNRPYSGATVIRRFSMVTLTGEPTFVPPPGTVVRINTTKLPTDQDVFEFATPDFGLYTNTLTLNFGSVAINSQFNLSLPVINSSNSAISISSIGLESGSYSISTTNLTIASGDTELIEIIFEPKELGLHAGSMTINSDDLTFPQYILTLEGEGLPPFEEGKINLLSRFDIKGEGKTRNDVLDVWGYYDESSHREFALVGYGIFAGPPNSGLHIIDVTDPSRPYEAAHLNTVPGFDVKTWQNYAYTVTGTGSGTGGIIDLINPDDPQVVGSFPSSHNVTIDENGFMYAESPGITIYDLKPDPTNPTVVWQGGSEGHDATIVGNTFYDFHGSAGTFFYDISNPASPDLLGSITQTPNIVYHHSGWPTKDGNYLYICDELSHRQGVETDITIWDISDIANPVLVNSIWDSMATIHNLFIVGDYVYTSYYNAGFKVFDAKDPVNPELIYEYDTEPNVDAVGFGSGAFGVYPYAHSGNIYVTDYNFGLFIFNSLDIASSVSETTLPQKFTVHDNYPNPFNPATNISYDLLEASHVEVGIFNILGQKIKGLLDENQNAGSHRLQWDGTNNNGIKVTSGVYYYRIDAGDKRVVKSMLLVK